MGAPHTSRSWQVMGLPVINVGGMKDSVGLPLGVQLIDEDRYDDALLFYAGWLKAMIR